MNPELCLLCPNQLLNKLWLLRFRISCWNSLLAASRSQLKGDDILSNLSWGNSCVGEYTLAFETCTWWWLRLMYILFTRMRLKTQAPHSFSGLWFCLYILAHFCYLLEVLLCLLSHPGWVVGYMLQIENISRTESSDLSVVGLCVQRPVWLRALSMIQMDQLCVFM